MYYEIREIPYLQPGVIRNLKIKSTKGRCKLEIDWDVKVNINLYNSPLIHAKINEFQSTLQNV